MIIAIIVGFAVSAIAGHFLIPVLRRLKADGTFAEGTYIEHHYNKDGSYTVKEYNGDIMRSAVELAKAWRTDRSLQKLEAMILVADKNKILLISGDGNVIEPEKDCIAIGF